MRNADRFSRAVYRAVGWIGAGLFVLSCPYALVRLPSEIILNASEGLTAPTAVYLLIAAPFMAACFVPPIIGVRRRAVKTLLIGALLLLVHFLVIRGNL
jgi:hypothetical protein